MRIFSVVVAFYCSICCAGFAYSHQRRFLTVVAVEAYEASFNFVFVLCKCCCRCVFSIVSVCQCRLGGLVLFLRFSLSLAFYSCILRFDVAFCVSLLQSCFGVVFDIRSRYWYFIACFNVV